jgi:hypothetical protein
LAELYDILQIFSFNTLDNGYGRDSVFPRHAGWQPNRRDNCAAQVNNRFGTNHISPTTSQLLYLIFWCDILPGGVS